MKEKDLRKRKDRKNEKGAAMVVILLVSLLLLTASVGFLLEASMNTANITDATAEQQAYTSAESGVQATLNVLRGNVVPNPLIDPAKPATDPVNRISFGKAVTVGTSNIQNDSNTVSRLSRWMTYDYAPGGINDNARVTLGFSSGGYTPQNGFAYKVTVTDPDNTSSIISYETVGQFFDPADSTWKSSMTVAGVMTASYTPYSINNLNVSSGLANTNFGRFTFIRTGTGTATLTEDIRFQVLVKMKAPYETVKAIRGWIKKDQSLSPGGNIQVDYDSPTYDLMGSIITLASDPMTFSMGSPNPINGTMTNAEPFRLVVRSVGYGPRGAKKELEATIQKNFFNGLSAPATLTLIGNTPGFNFEAGTSQNVAYSGSNVVNANEIVPPIGTTNLANLNSVLNNLETRGQKANMTGTPSDISAEVPFWLQSPKNLHDTITELRRTAEASGRLFANGSTPDTSDFGDNATATGITFVEGDASLRGNGGGILVCTGKLTLRGGFDFNGLIIVTGAGGIDRSGGGNGLLQGNTVIAPYNPANLNAGFLAPKYDISGGGNSTIRYNSNSVANGMTAVSNIVLGVAEK